MTSWKEDASARKATRRAHDPEQESKHRTKTVRPKNFGIASNWLHSLWFFKDRKPYIRWYETAAQRDQAYKQLIKAQYQSSWRVDRADVDAVRDMLQGEKE